MSLLASFAKWKLRWAVLSGVFTLIVFPVARLIFQRKRPTNIAKPSQSVIDVKAEEIK